MRKQLFLAAAAAGVLLSAGAAMPAMAAGTPVLTVGSAGGPAVNSGDDAAANLAAGTSATIFTRATNHTGVTCTSSAFDASVSANPTAPGQATEALNTQDFSSCTSNIFGVSAVDSITVENLPYSATVDDTASSITLSAGAAGPIQVGAELETLIGMVDCEYQPAGGSIAGTVTNSNNGISFSNIHFTLFSGPNVCPANGFFTATYAPVQDTTQGGQPIFVN